MPHDRYERRALGGDSFSLTIIVEDEDGVAQNLSAYAVTAEFRRHEDSAGNQLLALSEGSGLTVTDATGTIAMQVTKSQMATLFTDAGGTAGSDLSVVFDVCLSTSDLMHTILPGRVFILADAER